MAAVAAEYQGRVAILGVPGRGDVPEVQEFVADTGTGRLTHLVDADGSVWRRFGVVYQPAFALVSSDGTVRLHRGGMDEAELRAAANALLAGTR